jgi:nicotinate phosphoribosyltransferase
MEEQALFTDLYELTMLQAYCDEGMAEEAVFDLYVRSLPRTRNFLVAGGLEQALEYLEELQFSPQSLDFLDSLKLFSSSFLDQLARFRFSGQVRAVPEGTVLFPGEPLLEVTAPIPEAQLVETYLLNQVTFQTVIASKGARAVLTAQGRTLVDFGSRRAHGSDAGLKAARALYISGYDSTSNVLAGRLYGIPVAGTMAHSYIEAHDSELEAFRAFLRSYPETILLVDTYDTEAGVLKAADVARNMAGAHVRAVRLDSGDLSELAKRARRILDEAGLHDVGVFASGGLDEYEIRRLLSSGAPINGFGVGTAAVVSNDAPDLDSAYKLVSYAGRPRLKLSTDKVTLPGKKQVFRRYRDGRMAGDLIALAEEQHEGEPLLEEVMRGGRRTEAGTKTITAVRERARRQLETLPPSLRVLDQAPEPYPTGLSEGLERESREVRAALAREVARSPQ